MLQFPLITLLVIWSVQGSNGEGTNRIVGGTTAPEGSAPYQVSLRDTKRNIKCGGSILNNRWVMTAGHCIKADDNPGKYRIIAGTNYLTRGGKTYKVSKIVVHPDYSSNPLSNDIALLQVSEDIRFNDKTKPIALPERNTEGGANVMITGWGMFDPNQNAVIDYLQRLNVTTQTVEECRRRNANAKEFEICTVAKKGTGICMGDSGGPLVEENAVVGIASYLLNSCTYGYDSYTRVFYYKDWIQKTIS